MAVDELSLRRKFIQEKIGDGVAIIFNAKEVTRNNEIVDVGKVWG